MRVPNRLIRTFFCALFQQVKGKVKTLLKTVKNSKSFINY
mgnify:FL=1